ncbi:MAG: carbohydrate-binding family 9-like protein [Deltaproteobacteria bacterium]
MRASVAEAPPSTARGRGARPRAALALVGAMTCWASCTCGEPPRTAIPELRIHRAPRPPRIDGDLSEWGEAARTEVFVDTMDGSHGDLAPTARVMWDERALYLAFEVADPFLRSAGAQQDAHLWEEDCVELMFDPDGDEERYLELQVSPRNVVFDTWFDTYRAPRPFGHVGWSSGLESAVRVRGQVGDQAADEGYDVEIAIPWRAFSVAGRDGTPPREGETFRAQLYVLDAREEGQWGVGWSAPMVGDFHVPARFGRLVFER